jgi:homoserine acetyltransferase
MLNFEFAFMPSYLNHAAKELVKCLDETCVISVSYKMHKLQMYYS